ncbi:putative fluoride ion transporter CrcB [Salmonella enterica subsp. enterica serovar Choleraesuis]|nr:putative fluoride ion transporter CrcB [Salmonella enterica subsp. enterica serovar Choleraesuis]
MLKSLFAVMIGGGIGSALRWGISNRLNALFPSLPPGTLTANVVAGFIIGMALSWFMRQPQIDPVWRLFITTGVCGGLSTFSTFSSEILVMLQGGNWHWALISILVHVLGSLLAVFAGFTLISLIAA